MSHDDKVPARRGTTSLDPTRSAALAPQYPSTDLPVTPATYTSAFAANLRLKVSEHLYKRMNAVAAQHLQLQTTLKSITHVEMDRQSALAEWDDLDNRLVDEQDERDHRRRLSKMRREDELEEMAARRRRRAREEAMAEQQHTIALQKLTTTLDPSKASTANNAAAQFRAMMADVAALQDAGREEIEKLKTRSDLSQAERDEEIFKVRAALAQFAQHITQSGELPDDMRRQVMDAFNRA